MAPFSFSTIICGGPDQSTQQAKLVRISDLANSEQFFLLFLRLWSLSCSKCSIKKTKNGILLVSSVWSYVRISIKSSRILSWYTSSSGGRFCNIWLPFTWGCIGDSSWKISTDPQEWSKMFSGQCTMARDQSHHLVSITFLELSCAKNAIGNDDSDPRFRSIY